SSGVETELRPGTWSHKSVCFVPYSARSRTPTTIDQEGGLTGLMDFFRIKERVVKSGVEIYPDFRVCRSKDLMVRGRSFYAIWDEGTGLWSTDEYDVQRLVDDELMKYREQVQAEGPVNVKLLSDFSSNSWLQFRNYVGHVSDNAKQLDEHLTFSNTVVRKEDYVSRRLPYPLQAGEFKAWDEIISTLYSPEER